MEIKGLTSDDLKPLNDLLTKANHQQLVAMIKQLKKEIHKRKEE